MYARSRRFTIARAFNQLLRLFLAALFVAVSAPALLAQAESLREGVRVRLETRATGQLVGIVKSVSRDSIQLFTDASGASLSLGRQDVTRLSVSQGRSAAQGAMRGGMWGSAVGAVLAAAVLVTAQADDSEIYTDGVGAFAFQMLLGGAMWGAGIGAFVKRERWSSVDLQPRIVAPPSGTGFGFSVKPGFLH